VNREIVKPEWKKKEDIESIDPFVEVGSIVDEDKLLRKIKEIASEYTCRECIECDTLFEKETIEENDNCCPKCGGYAFNNVKLIEECNPLKNRDSLITFGRQWTPMYAMSYPDTDEEAIANACCVMYYIDQDIEPCRDKLDAMDKLVPFDSVCYRLA
jgi:hypothetical protein